MDLNVDVNENKREKRLASNKARLEAIEKHRQEVQKAFQKEQAEEKEKYLKECERALYYGKDNVKNLNRALLFSEVLRTREEQIKFDQKLKEVDDKLEAAYVEKCKKDLEDYKREMELKKQKKIEKEHKQKEDLLAQIKCKEEEKVEEENEKLREREDLIAIKREIDMAEKCEESQKTERKAKYKKEMEENLVNDKEFKESKKRDKKVTDKLIDIYANAKRRMANLQKTREQQLKEAKLLTRAKLSKYIADQMHEKESDEDARIQKAIAEREAKMEEQRLEKEAYEKRLIQEREDAYQEYLQQEKKRKKEEEEMLKWEMMQRFKQNEENKKFHKQKEEKRTKEVLALRESCIEQIKLREEVLEKEKEEAIEAAKFERMLFTGDDEAFLSYADEVLQDCKQKGRPLRPIQWCIDDYKKSNGLDQVPKVHPALKPSVKISTTPDPPQYWGPCQPRQGSPCSKDES